MRKKRSRVRERERRERRRFGKSISNFAISKYSLLISFRLQANEGWFPTGVRSDGSYKLLANIVNPWNPLWGGNNGRQTWGKMAVESDYWVDIDTWMHMIDYHDGPVDLVFKIYMNPSSSDYTLIFSDFRLDGSLRYR